MSCVACTDTDIDARCPKCGRLPNDTQLAILTEAYDCVDSLEKFHTGHFPPEVTQAIKVLTGVVKQLIVDNKRLNREVLVLKESDKYQ